MSSSTSCRVCTRALRAQSRFSIAQRLRPFSTTIHPSAKQQSQPQSTSPNTSSQVAAAKGIPSANSQSQASPVNNVSRVNVPGNAAHPRSKDSQGQGQTLSQRLAFAVGDATNVTSTYMAFGATEILFKKCADQADYKVPQAADANLEIPKDDSGEDIGVGQGGWWLDGLKLPPTFSTWSHVTFLHMYLLFTRFRHFPRDSAKDHQQHLVNHCFNHMEERMVLSHRIHSGSIRQRYLKDFFAQWRGCILSYDEGLVKGDAVMANAIWRNLFKGREDVDGKGLAMVVGWMRRELSRLEKDVDGVQRGQWTWSNPGEEKAAVLFESNMMRKEAKAS